MELTPEGYLLCRNVPIARTGEMMYGPGETTLDVGPNGYVIVRRYAQDVFRPETIASFNGKSIVDDHPDSDVTPENWQALAVGVVLEPRRGEGAQDDMLIADLLFTVKEAIEQVQNGKREVSCGYDADYDELEPGIGVQYNIIGNHVALVDSGRCGIRCRIHDSAFSIQGEKKMKVLEFKNKVRDAVKKMLESNTKDCDSMEKILGAVHDDAEISMPATHHERGAHYTDDDLKAMFEKYDRMHAEAHDRLSAHDAKHRVHDERITKLEQEEHEVNAAAAGHDAETEHPARQTEEPEKELEGELEEEAPPGTGDRARKAKDSAYLSESFENTVAMAEIIVPGIQIPTFDRAAAPKKSLDNICAFRKKVLTQATKDSATSEMISGLRRGRVLDEAVIQKMPCAAVRDLFFSLAALKKQDNNHSTTSSEVTYPGLSGAAAGGSKRFKNPGDLNKFNAEYYKQ